MGFKLENINSVDDRRVDEGRVTSILQKEITFFGKSFSNKKKEDFYTEISVLLKAGINLKEALHLIEENEKKERIRLFFKDIGVQLVAGMSFSEIIKSKSEFTEYEYYSLRIGEETGTMSKICEELGKFFTRKNEQRRSLINALTYPVIILGTAVLVVIFMLRLVVPMFQDIFKQNNVELPGITKFIVSISDFIGAYGWWVVLILMFSIVFRKLIVKNETVKRYRDYLLLKLPYVGNFIRAVYLTQFTQAISLLTSSKVPILNSIEMVSRMIDFYPLRDALKSVESDLIKGKSLSDSLKGNKIFDNRMISLVRVAEETNQTEFIFSRLNDQYNIQVQQKSKLMSTLMEPLIILFVGIVVGVILIAMYLPMFKLGSVLG
jgi:type II secretory pathway component PulF